MNNRYLLAVFILTATLLFGCADTSVNDTDTIQAVPTTQPVTDPVTAPTISQKPMIAVSVPVITDAETTVDGTTIFRHTYQSINITSPDAEAANRILLDFMNRVDPENANAQSIAKSAKADYHSEENWGPYLFQCTYEPTRLDSCMLSFFGSQVSYAGAPHPETQYLSVSYDLTTGAVLHIHDILVENVDPELLSSKVCQVLLPQKDALGLYDGFEDTVRERFTKRIALDEDWYFTDEGLCFYFAPYEIGPYASGVITAQVPYGELTGILSDAWFPPEEETACGMLYARRYTGDLVDDFSQFTELTLDASGEKILLFTDSYAQNVTIETGTVSEDDVFVPQHTVFSAAHLTPGDAIVMQYDPAEIFRIVWHSNNEENSRIVTPEHGVIHAPVSYVLN